MQHKRPQPRTPVTPRQSRRDEGRVEVPSTPEASAAPDKPARKRLKPASKVDLAAADAAGRDPRDSLIVGMVAQARKKHGDRSVLVGAESDRLVVVLPGIPLAFQALIGQSGFPLGGLMQLTSPPGVGKSGLLAQIIDWFDRRRGIGVLHEVESKVNPVWYRSHMSPEAYSRMIQTKSDSLEQWQRFVTDMTNDSKRRLTAAAHARAKGLPKKQAEAVARRVKTVPYVQGVDSITARQSEATAEKILGEMGASGLRGSKGEGAAGRGHPVEAMSITRYTRTIFGDIPHWPFAVVFVNQERESTDKQGHAVQYTTGGRQVNFQEGYEVRLGRTGGNISCSEFEGYAVQLSLNKNSFAPTARHVRTRLLWKFEKQTDPVTGEVQMVQKSWWDWDWSLVDLLINVLEGDYKVSLLQRAAARDFGLHVKATSVATVENKAWSKNLGMTEDDAVPWAELGRRLAADPETVKLIRRSLFITERTEFDPWQDHDYDEVRFSAAQGMA